MVTLLKVIYSIEYRKHYTIISDLFLFTYLSNYIIPYFLGRFSTAIYVQLCMINRKCTGLSFVIKFNILKNYKTILNKH